MRTPFEPLPIAVVGPGRMGRLYAKLADDLAHTRLVAIAGRSEPPTSTLAAAHGVPGYPNADYRRMLADHPDIEAVVIAVSEWEHVDPVLAAIDKGKHVLIEKPMAVSPRDAATMVERADQAGVVLMVCHSLRFSPRYALMREAVTSGRIGDILNIHARRNATPMAADRVVGKFPLAYWLTPHDIDMMLWTVGSPVTRIRATSRSGADSRTDYILATLTFANGAVGTLENSWGTPAQGGRPHNEIFSVYGTAGAAEVRGYEHGLVLYGTEGRVDYPETVYSPIVHGQTEGAFRALLRHFALVVRGRAEPIVTGRDGLAAIRVAEALDRALSSGRDIDLATE